MRLAATTFLIAFVLVLAAALQTGLNRRAKLRLQAERTRLQTTMPN